MAMPYLNAIAKKTPKTTTFVLRKRIALTMSFYKALKVLPINCMFYTLYALADFDL
jgi:hypothetical protein